MTPLDHATAATAGFLLLLLAWKDARRFRIHLGACATLAATGLVWHATTPSQLGLVSAAWWMPAAGLAAGAGIVAVIIAAAELARRPWPIMPGDGILLAAIGAVVGPLGLAFSILAACPATLAYRRCLQAKRGRPMTRGYVPLTPGVAAGTCAVLAMLACGGAVAGEGSAVAAAEAGALAAHHWSALMALLGMAAAAIDGQLVTLAAIVLVTALACWDVRHRTVGIWPAAALLVTGLAWHMELALRADEPALVLAVWLGGVIVGALLVAALCCLHMLGYGRWPLSPGGLLLGPALVTCLGPLTGFAGVMIGLLFGIAVGAWNLFAREEEEKRRRCPLLACVTAGMLIAIADSPPDVTIHAAAADHPTTARTACPCNPLNSATDHPGGTP